MSTDPSPAYLSEAETYYLRRLTSRPLHKRQCPFYLPQALDSVREPIKDSLFGIEYPKGLFNAHKEAPEKLAQEPLDKPPDDSGRAPSIPRLARLMWMLLEAAHTNILPPPLAEGNIQPSIRHEFSKIRRASERFHIARRIPLTNHLYFTARDYESLRVHARLRKAAKNWPSEIAPQAFLLLEAYKISGKIIHTGLGDIEVRNRIQHTGIIKAEVEPPFLVLAVIGEHSKREGYLPLRAYAQPIFKGNQFIPVERQMDRNLLKQIQTFQNRMFGKQIEVAVKKPLFNLFTRAGGIRPDLIVAFTDYTTGLVADFAIQVLRESGAEYLALKSREKAQIEKFHRVLSIDHSRIATPDFQNDLARMIETA